MDEKELQDLWNKIDVDNTENMIIPNDDDNTNNNTENNEGNKGENQENEEINNNDESVNNESTQKEQSSQEEKQESKQVSVQQPNNASTSNENNDKKQETDSKNKNPATIDDIDNYFKKKEQERLLIEEENKKKEELKQKEEQERLERERLENETIFKDFNFNRDGVLTDDEKKEIKKVEEDFPEISKYFDLKVKQIEKEYEERLKFLEKNTKKGLTDSYLNMYDKISKELSPVFDTVKVTQQHYQEQAKEKFVNELNKIHPDWEERTEELFGWFDKLDVEIAEGMKKMATSGDVAKVAKVFDYYKKENNITTNTQSTNNQQNNSKIASKKDALRAVSGKNSNPSNNTASNKSYEDLWNDIEV